MFTSKVISSYVYSISGLYIDYNPDERVISHTITWHLPNLAKPYPNEAR